MDIQKIANTLIRGEKVMVFPLKYEHQWVIDQQGHHILDIRGWGFIQYMGAGAEEFQDEIGLWVTKTLNEAWEKSCKKKS